MTLLRFFNPQGIAGLAASICLAILLVIQKAETRHWTKRSAEFERLYDAGQVAHLQTLASYRAAAEQARRNDVANAERVLGEQAKINQETKNGLERRLAGARAGRLQRNSEAAGDPRRGGAAPVPGISAPAVGVAHASVEDRLPRSERLMATEQAIQLHELIDWVRKQHSVDPNAEPAHRP